jgi:hypothetical protein
LDALEQNCKVRPKASRVPPPLWEAAEGRPLSRLVFGLSLDFCFQIENAEEKLFAKKPFCDHKIYMSVCTCVDRASHSRTRISVVLVVFPL